MNALVSGSVWNFQCSIWGWLFHSLAQGGVDVLFFRAVLSAMVGCTSKLEVLGIYTFSQRSCILSAHWGLQSHTNWKTPEQGGLVLLPAESIRLVSGVSWHPGAVQRWTTHAQRYPGYVLALRHIPTWIFTIFIQYFHRICFGGDIIRKSYTRWYKSSWNSGFAQERL